LPDDVHGAAARALRDPLGADPRLRDADDPVLDADAARSHDGSRRRLYRSVARVGGGGPANEPADRHAAPPPCFRRRSREDVRSFLAEHAPAAAAIPHALDDRMAFLREWQARCYDAGFVGRAWPAEFGGGGRSTSEQIVVDQELAAAGAPEFPSVVGLDVLGPALLEFGTDEQRTRHGEPS